MPIRQEPYSLAAPALLNAAAGHGRMSAGRGANHWRR